MEEMAKRAMKIVLGSNNKSLQQSEWRETKEREENAPSGSHGLV
jgi:hypothetical protein